MERAKLNFGNNWNNKLASGFFTTIRRHNPELHDGMGVELWFQNKFLRYAEIFRVETMKFSALPSVIIILDTGYPVSQSLGIFMKLLKAASVDDLMQTEIDLLIIHSNPKKQSTC